MTTTQTESSATATTSTSRGAGPLTTVFTTPDFCKTLYWQNTVTPPLSSSVCMPPRFHQYWDYKWGFYSPGICPSGYTKGCSFPTTLASTSLGMVYFGGPVIEGESVQVCCPTGYSCLTDATSSYSKCVATEPTDLVFAIHVRWQESDLSILETNPTVPGSTYSSPATVTASTTQSEASSGSTGSVVIETSKASSDTTNAATSESESAASADSSKATIGIAVGAMALAFGLSAMFFFIWRCRKRRRQMRSGSRLSSTITLEKLEPNTIEKPELDSTMVVRPIPPSPNPSELQAERDVAEMAAPQFVAELPGSMPSGYQERKESTEWPVSPADTAKLSAGEVAEPSPLSETSGSRRGRMSFRDSAKESPILPPNPSRDFTPSSGSVPRRRQSTLRESALRLNPSTLCDRES